MIISSPHQSIFLNNKEKNQKLWLTYLDRTEYPLMKGDKYQTDTSISTYLVAVRHFCINDIDHSFSASWNVRMKPPLLFDGTCLNWISATNERCCWIASILGNMVYNTTTLLPVELWYSSQIRSSISRYGDQVNFGIWNNQARNDYSTMI